MGTEAALIIGAAVWLALIGGLLLIWHRYVIRDERTARRLAELDELDRRDRLGLVTPADDELAERRELRRYGRNR